MANFICEFKGIRGRTLRLYDTKCVIITKISVGSVVTGNATDGEKTLFFKDITGVQFKKSGLAIGYLQFETPSMQMNHIGDNFFSENTFTFGEGKYGITNHLMQVVYDYIVDRLEEVKYDVKIINTVPDFEAMKVYKEYENSDYEEECVQKTEPRETVIPEYNRRKNKYSCPKCGSNLERNQKYCLCSCALNWSDL